MMRRSKGPQRQQSCEDDEDAYFTYRPLSNLPTPPSSRNSTALQCPDNALLSNDLMNPKFIGPAVHLVNLIPASASLSTPSVPLVQALLTRCGLPIDIIALAVCILDSLDSKKFARRWRAACPLIENSVDVDADAAAAAPSARGSACLPPSPLASPSRNQAPGHTRHHSRMASQTHIDSVQPEVIILAALVIAAKFLQDPQDPSDYYCRVWARDMWSCAQLNATEWCLMEEVGYRIMPLCDEDLLADAMVDMQLAGRYAVEEKHRLQRGWHVPRDLSPPESLHTRMAESTFDMSDSLAVGLGLRMPEFDMTTASEADVSEDDEPILGWPTAYVIVA